MTKKEAKQYTLKYIADIFISNGFTEKKKSSSDIEFKRKTETGEDGMYLHYKDYNPKQITAYYFYKRIKAVDDIVKEIGKHLTLSPPITKETHTVTFDYISLKQYRVNGSYNDTYLPSMQTEEDVKVACGRIIEFLEEDALPLLDKFNDLREIDKIINGDNFWFTDWQREFGLGGNFHLKRIIIPYLTKNKDLESIIERQLADVRSKFDDEYGWSSKEVEKEILFLVDYLKTLLSLSKV